MAKDNNRPGTRSYYEHQKALAEASVDRKLLEIYKQRLIDLRQEAAKQGIHYDTEFTTWLDQPGMGGVSSETVTDYVEVDGGALKEMTWRKSLSRRDALNAELRALKQRLMAREGFDSDDEATSPFAPSAPETKAAPLRSVKMSASGRISGYLAAFGNVDAYHDIIVPGAFKECLRRNRRSGKQVPLLWQHDPAKPIGAFKSLDEDDHGLKAVAQIDLDVEDGRRAYSGIKAGYIKGLSIGYSTDQEEQDAKGNRLLKAVTLMEGSIVTFPANEQATIIAYE